MEQQDTELVRVIRENVHAHLAIYRQRETECRTMAKKARSAETRQRYKEEADRYKRYISNIDMNVKISIVSHQNSQQPELKSSGFIVNLLAARLPLVHRVQQLLQQPSTKSAYKPMKFPNPLPANVPNQFMCPITMDIMTDPVMLADGHVYERAAIEQWFETYDTSPMSNCQVDKNIMIPCIVLRSLMQEFFEKPAKSDPIEPIEPVEPVEPVPAKQKRKPSKYNLFVKERMPILLEQNPGLKPKDVMKLIGAEWKARQ